ncbi:MAG: twin-arginine translocation signal domain-containing protein [Coriobacteriales bacterium]|nr:twin-arginine translocation signal domain-containing protein [Coriobacteriales bacterium]
MSNITRRQLLKDAALGSAAVAALGGASFAMADEAPAAGKHSWEVKPEPITDIAEEIDTEVLIIGGGYSGAACACNGVVFCSYVIMFDME